jgi:hypothetical protein
MGAGGVSPQCLSIIYKDRRLIVMTSRTSKVLNNQYIEAKHSKLYYKAIEVLGGLSVMVMLSILTYAFMCL